MRLDGDIWYFDLGKTQMEESIIRTKIIKSFLKNILWKA